AVVLPCGTHTNRARSPPWCQPPSASLNWSGTDVSTDPGGPRPNSGDFLSIGPGSYVGGMRRWAEPVSPGGSVSVPLRRKETMVRRFLGVFMAVVVTGAFAAGDDKHQGKEAGKNTAFETLKGLKGEWVSTDKDGKPTDQVVSV